MLVPQSLALKKPDVFEMFCTSGGSVLASKCRRPRSGVNKFSTTKSGLEDVSSKSCSDVIPTVSKIVHL